MSRRSRASRAPHHVVRIAWCVLLIIAMAGPVLAQSQPTTQLIAMGDGYAEVYAGFSKAAVANAQNGQVNILVLPVNYSTDPLSITDADRAAFTRETEVRRLEIEAACKAAANDRVTCTAIAAPIFTRAEANDPSIIKYFLVDLAAIFIPGGEPTSGMRVIAGTALEAELTKAYQNGVIVAGTGAGGSVLSSALLAGYAPKFDAASALNFGAVEVWRAGTQRGLSFGMANALIDSRFYQDNRLGRLLNAISQAAVPHVGIGVDAATGVSLYGEARVQDVFGAHGVTVLDAETYHAAEGVRYSGPANTLSLRNVLIHMLAPGRVSYDLTKRAITLQNQAVAPRPKLDRTFAALALPKAAGPLLLAGNLSGDLATNSVLKRYAELADNPRRRILIAVTGYASDQDAQTTAEQYAAALNMPADIVVIPDRAVAQPLVVTKDVTGIVLLARDQAKVKPQALSLIEAAWRGGLPLLAVDGGAAIAGRYFVMPTPAPVEAAFIKGTTTISNGLNLLNVMIEPQVLGDNRWGRLFALTYAHPDVLALGLSDDTALELSADGARVIGENALIALDLRTSQRALGDDDQFIVANALLDVFAPGDEVKPATADSQAQPVSVGTPVIPTVTPTRTITPTPTPTATRRPPTPTPTATATLEPTPMPTPVPVNVTSTPVFPFALGLGAVILLIVLLAARRPVKPAE